MRHQHAAFPCIRNLREALRPQTTPHGASFPDSGERAGEQRCDRVSVPTAAHHSHPYNQDAGKAFGAYRQNRWRPYCRHTRCREPAGSPIPASRHPGVTRMPATTQRGFRQLRNRPAGTDGDLPRIRTCCPHSRRSMRVQPKTVLLHVLKNKQPENKLLFGKTQDAVS